MVEACSLKIEHRRSSDDPPSMGRGTESRVRDSILPLALQSSNVLIAAFLQPRFNILGTASQVENLIVCLIAVGQPRTSGIIEALCLVSWAGLSYSDSLPTVRHAIGICFTVLYSKHMASQYSTIIRTSMPTSSWLDPSAASLSDAQMKT